ATGPDAEFAMLEMGRIVPVYESLGGTTSWGAKLGSKWLRRVVWSIFEELVEGAAKGSGGPSFRASSERVGCPSFRASSERVGCPSFGSAEETLPPAMLQRLRLP